MSEGEGPNEGATPRAEGSAARTAETNSSSSAARKRRRRGSRGGRNRSKSRGEVAGTGSSGASAKQSSGDEAAQAGATPGDGGSTAGGSVGSAGTPPRPKIGDTMPAPPAAEGGSGDKEGSKPSESGGGQRRRRGGRGRSGGRRGQADGGGGGGQTNGAQKGEPESGSEGRNGERTGGRARVEASGAKDGAGATSGGSSRRRRRRGGRGSGGDGSKPAKPVEAVLPSEPVELDEKALAKRRGRERKGRPVGRYLMCVHVAEKTSQIAVMEGRSMIEHYVSRPSDDVSQIHGNVYVGRVQNVLPGMEAAFVDIGTPKNAVLYRGDVHFDPDDVEHAGQPRIEKLLKGGQNIICQVTKNPIGAKGARLTQEVSLPGRYVVLIPNSSTYGISKRLPDDERRRLRQLLDRVKPDEHGIIVRTAAEGATSEEIENDVRRLVAQWQQIASLAKRSKAPTLLYREPDMAVRVIREEFNKDYRGVVIDDRDLYESVREYVASINPTLADRVEFYDPEVEKLPLFERHHVHEQLHRALDRKVWLPSGGSLIIEHTEALTVVDVNTGKNVGRSSLEETVFKNNLEAAVEIARQLRLRDIGGIIVIDYIDMERRENRDEVIRVFREALARDKTRTQVFEISELGLCEMTRKRIGEGLLESYSTACPMCEGRGHMLDRELLPE